MHSKSTALYTLTNLLQPVRRVWKQAVTLALADECISISQAILVVQVYEHPQGINQRELAEVLGINPGALVRLLDQATAAEWLERREVPGDRRARTLHILPLGEKLAQTIKTATDKLRLELMPDVSLEEIEQSIRVLRYLEEQAAEYVQHHKD